MNLLPLALQSLTDAEALLVLGDAVLEAGWWDERVQHLVVGHGNSRTSQRKSGRKNMRWFRHSASKPTEAWARGVVSVLLFEGMSSKRWPGVERSVRPPPKPADVARLLRQLWPQNRIQENLYAESPFLRMLRRTA